MEFRSRLVTAQVQAACRPFFCKNKIGNSWLTNAAFHGILIDVDGALAQLVAHNTGSVGVRSSNLLCSTKPKKSEHHPDWGWVRISSFYLKYCGVNNKMNERRQIGIIPIVPALKNNDRARTHHAGEDAAQLQQLCGQVLFCHRAVLQHHDLIRAGNGAHPMGNDENSFVRMRRESAF